MITVISPAKTLDLSPVQTSTVTEPQFKKEIKELAGIMQKKSRADLQALMNISENIADLNKERFKNFSSEFTLANSKPALFAFKGDVYRKMNVEDYSQEQLAFAQEHLRILSGLYGLLKPLDLMQPYRLEMGIKLKNKKADDLYGFWQNKITKALDEAATDGTVINLASQEYFKAINPKKLKAKVIHITFKEYREGKYKIIAIFAKQARGLMANYIIENQINEPELLKLFNVDQYEYSEQLSTADEWVFIR
ncbi:MAG TPA: peroxide stress protein YaaA [Cyclobacteriaceae bacterium]|nr:peroxide stress protein YaaA [Cyclobacteriaceae bacterium]